MKDVNKITTENGLIILLLIIIIINKIKHLILISKGFIKILWITR